MGGTIASGGSAPMLPPVTWAGTAAYGSASDAGVIGGGPTPNGVAMPQPVIPQPTSAWQPVQPAPTAQPQLSVPQTTAPTADIVAALTKLTGLLQQLASILAARQGAAAVQGGGGSGCSCGGGMGHAASTTGGAQAAPDAAKAQEAKADKPKRPAGGGGGGGSAGASTAKPASITGAAQKQSGETSYDGLQQKSLAVLNAAHGHGLKLISGLRAGETQGHGNGSAVDVSNTPGGSRQGSPEMRAFAEAMRAAGKAGDPNVGYVIYQQQIASSREGWRWRDMEDRGSNTANHFDHVHVSTDPNR